MKVFRDVILLEEAIKKLKEFYKPKPKVEEVDLFNATGRVSAEDVYAISDVPPFDRATMDGYAVKAEDTFEADEENPVRLKVLGYISAGEWKDIEVTNGCAVEIATGAPMPKGSNAVVMVEYTKRIGDYVEIFKAVAPGENVMSAGSDVMQGELILRKGDIITHRDIGVLASCGISKVKVYKRPTVAIISTGNELVEVGKELEFGKIYDVNSYTLFSAVEENGGKALFLGIARDKEDEIERLIRRGLEIADIVITSGGTSAGVGDIVYRVLNKWKPGVIVHGIAVKPGKPAIIAICNGKPVFGLPGYPTSALIVFEVLVAPILRALAGIPKEENRIRAKIATKTFSAEGRREFLPVNIAKGSEGYMAYPVSGYYSGAITSLAFSDGFIEIPENVVMLEEGENVEVKLFSRLKPADLMIIGSHCIGVDIILRILNKIKPINTKVINVGSTGGILAIKRGEADIAGTHLLDESGVYNEPFIRKYRLRDVVLVKGYLREQGFIVKRGNPKRIKSFRDLLREDVTFINRNKGSGTRILLDMNLKKLANDLGIDFDEVVKSIKGYEVEAKTHTSVAVSVLSGKADVGIGIKSVAIKYGLDFIPIRAEEYDFLIRKDRLNKESVKLFLNVLKSEEFSKELEKIGMKTYERTGEMIEF